jgi:hypothetical protein
MTFINTGVFAQLASTLTRTKEHCQAMQGHTSGDMLLSSIVTLLSALRAADIRAAEAGQEMARNPTAATRASEANGGPATVTDFQAQGLAIADAAGLFTQLVASEINRAALSVTVAPTPHSMGSTLMVGQVMVPEAAALAIAGSTELQDLIDALEAAGA